MKIKQSVLSLILPVLFAVILVPAVAEPLAPAKHGDFKHYTLALTWQPGFCGTESGCEHNQPTNVLIGLHGLWTSRPQSLISSGVQAAQWWHRGCDYFHHSDAAPSLRSSLRRRLQQVMPHLRFSLLKHEYDKHVQCFNFNASNFFSTELNMRHKVMASAFGRYLTHEARGASVYRATATQAFMEAFSTHKHAAMQLRCAKSHRGREVLTQIWITLHADSVKVFPRPSSLMNAPIDQNNCPQEFLVPNWP